MEKRNMTSANGIYHIGNRANYGHNWPLPDRVMFDLAVKIISKMEVKFHLINKIFTLMPNHYHWEVKITDGNGPKVRQYFHRELAKAVGQKIGRPGHLFQGHGFSKLLKSQSAVDTVARYIYLNPVRKGLVKRAQDFEFCSANRTYDEGVKWQMDPRVLEEAALSRQMHEMSVAAQRCVAY